METKDLLYYKVGRKYRPIGVCYSRDYLGPGLWYCSIRPGVRETTNADHYIGTLLKVSDDIKTPILKQCEMHKVAQQILQDFDFHTPKSTQELVEEIVAKTFEICKDDAV